MRSSSALCSSLAVTCLCQGASPRAVGAWRCWSHSTASTPPFLLLSATPGLHFEKHWMWISPWFSDCWFVLLSATRCALQSHPHIMFMSAWFQTRDLWLHLMLFTISNGDCFGGSFKPVGSWGRNILPGAVLQLLHDETALERLSVIMIVVLVWKCFRMGNLKARECGLERIINCWYSLWKCASCPQQKKCNQLSGMP